MKRKPSLQRPFTTPILVGFLGLVVGTATQAAPGQNISVPGSAAYEPEPFDLSLAPPRLAATPGEDAWDDYADHWHYRSNLSLWAAGVNGTVGKGNFETDVDVSFTDLVDKLTLGFGLDSELRKGRFAVILFGQYQHFEADAKTPRGFDADAKANFALIDIALAYQVFDVSGGSPDARFSVEAIGGFRWTYLSTEVEINQGPFTGRSENREMNWFDPYVGARLRYDFDRHWNVSALGTIGGFGVGSDLAWSAYGQIEYRFDAKWSFILGYRAINYDYEDNGFIFDVTMHGPVIGLGIRL